MTRKKQLSPLISGCCCGICFLLSGGCGCHSDEWGRSVERLYHSDGKHRDRAREKEQWRASRREEAGEGEGTGEERWTTARQKKREQKMTMVKRRESDSSGDWRRRQRDAVWVAGWLSAWVWMCKHTQSSSDWHRTCSRAQQAFFFPTHHICCATCQVVALVRLAAFSSERFQLKELKWHQQTVFWVPEAVVKTICLEDVACTCLDVCDRGLVVAAEPTAGKLWETVCLFAHRSECLQSELSCSSKTSPILISELKIQRLSQG